MRHIWNLSNCWDILKPIYHKTLEIMFEGLKSNRICDIIIIYNKMDNQQPSNGRNNYGWNLCNWKTKKIKTRIIPKLKVQRLSAEMPLEASIWLRNGRLSFMRWRYSLNVYGNIEKTERSLLMLRISKVTQFVWKLLSQDSLS